MPQPKKGPRFGGSPSHHKHIVGNLATELFRHGRIETTWAKAKRVQPLADRMVSFAKRGDLHARRQVHQVIRDRDVAHKLFEDVAPAFVGRNGGYTRVLKTGSRKGDGAMLALIELVEATDGQDASTALTEAPRRRWSLRRRRGTVSQTAREREEELAAAEDRGEDSQPEPGPEEPEAPAGEPDPTGLDPTAIDQRLAAAEEAEADADTGDTAEADEAPDEGEAGEADHGGTAEPGGEADSDSDDEKS